MNKKDQEIERKLKELESAVLKEQEEVKSHPPAALEKSTELTVTENKKKQVPAETSVGNDLCYFGGVGLLLTGLFVLLQHIKVFTPPMLSMFGIGGQGLGLILIPLLFGIGWIVYDSKNRYAWLLSAASCALIFFSILSSMVMSFPQMSLLGTLFLLAPFAVGGALLVKGMGGPKGIEDKLKK